MNKLLAILIYIVSTGFIMNQLKIDTWYEVFLYLIAILVYRGMLLAVELDIKNKENEDE